jgi:hypothetical protein
MRQAPVMPVACLSLARVDITQFYEGGAVR